MLGNDLRENNPLSTEEIEYPLENILTKLICKLTVLTGWCVASTEAAIDGNICGLVMAAYGAETSNQCVDSIADTCCPPTQCTPDYRPFEMEYLEDRNTKKLR
jgi:hypothetical protein